MRHKKVSIVKPAKMHCCTTINTHINVTKQPVLPLLAVAQHNKLHYVSKTVSNMKLNKSKPGKSVHSNICTSNQTGETFVAWDKCEV